MLDSGEVGKLKPFYSAGPLLLKNTVGGLYWHLGYTTTLWPSILVLLL